MGFSGSAPENKPAAVPVQAPAAQAAPTAAGNDIIAVIAAAIAASLGSETLACIPRRPNGNWGDYARAEATTIRSRMF